MSASQLTTEILSAEMDCQNFSYEHKRSAGLNGRGFRENSRGEVRRDVGSISGAGAEETHNLKGRYIQKINKQKNKL